MNYIACLNTECFCVFCQFASTIPLVNVSDRVDCSPLIKWPIYRLTIRSEVNRKCYFIKTNNDETIDNEFNNLPQQASHSTGISVVVTVTITSTQPVEVTVTTVYNDS